jgi:hypothetical protein
MFSTLRNTIDSIRATRVRQRSRYGRATADIPPTLYAYWKSTAHTEFKGIPSDAFFFARATEGLLTFFDCVRHSEAACALPSAAADSVWHAWSRLDRRQLDWLCTRHFGRAIPHVEAAGMHIDAALASCLVAARKLDGLPPGGASVPRLFALDRELRMPKGYAYSAASSQVAFRNMNQRGEGEGWLHAPAALAPVSLLAAGLISQDEYACSLRKAHPDGASCGSTAGSSTSGDSAACDSAGSGCSCGSSCGGGGCGS